MKILLISANSSLCGITILSWTPVLLAVNTILKKNINFNHVIDEFASVKARKVKL
jgi:hypothetical protein